MMKTKVLVISTVGLIYDGITNVILSCIEAMDLSGIDLYVVGTIKVEKSIKQRLEQQGCKVIDFPNRKKETFSYWKKLISFIRYEHINVVHAHGNSATLAIELSAALLGGAKKRIAHSHNTKCDQVKADRLLRPLFYAVCNKRLACGVDAGNWLFRDKDFTVINNGRDINRFRFQQSKREQYREVMGIEQNEILYGHVGGFVPQKNHNFLLKVFKEISAKEPLSKFVLVGDGVLKNQIEQSANKLGLQSKVFFTGNVDNVEDYLSACDIMLLPSFFEGLPLVMIEWQISGLPCLISDAVTKECIISKSVESLDLGLGESEWASSAIKMVRYRDERIQLSDLASKNAKIMGFDINKSAALLREIYCQ